MFPCYLEWQRGSLVALVAQRTVRHFGASYSGRRMKRARRNRKESGTLQETYRRPKHVMRVTESGTTQARHWGKRSELMAREFYVSWGSWFGRMGITMLCLMGTLSARANNVAVVVGTSDYRSADVPDLRFADDDARLMAKTLTTFMGYKKEFVRVLTSKPQDGEQEATAANISKAIGEMAQKQADAAQSTFLFFASAHGIETEKGAMLAAKDFNSKQPLENGHDGLTASALTKRLGSLKSGLVVAMFDICRKDGLIRSRKEKPIKQAFVLSQGNARRAATLFSSSEGMSFESEELKHGYFTYYLCQGLSARKTEKDALLIVGALDEAESVVTLTSLHSYVSENVLEKTRNLSGAGGTRTTAGRQTDERAGTVGVPSDLGGQLPELVCGETTKQYVLARYAKGKYTGEVSTENEFKTLRKRGLNAYYSQKYAKAADYFSDAFDVKQVGGVAYAAGDCYYRANQFADAERWWQETLRVEPKASLAMYCLGVLSNEQGKPKEAARWWRKAIETHPQYAEAMYNLGVFLMKQGKNGEAEQWYRKTIVADPKFTFAINNLGILLDEQGKVEEAEQWYRKILVIDPKNANAMTNMGQLASHLNRQAEEEAWYRKALEADPKFLQAMLNLGNLFFRQDKLDEAERLYHQVLAIEAKNAYALYNLGMVMKKRNRLPETESWVREAIEANPKYANAMYLLGLVLHAQKKPNEVEYWLRKAAETDPKQSEAMYILGLLLEERGKVQEAEGWYRKAIESNPKLAKAMFKLGRTLEKQEKIAEAEQWYRKALEVEPKYVPAMSNLGMLLDFQGKLTEAEQWYRKALEIDPKETIAIIFMGTLLKKQGKLAEAEQWYRKVLEIDPQNSAAMFFLGVLFDKQGKPKEAEQWLRKAIEVDPKDHSAMNSLGVALHKQGRLKDAEDLFRNATQIRPNAGLYHANLAEVLFDTNRKEEAFVEAKKAQELGVKEHDVYKKLGLKPL